MEICQEILDLVKDNPRLKSVVGDIGSKPGHIYPFNCAPLDITLGGGMMSGKIYEVYGWESQGKSTLALEATKAFANYWKSKGHKKFGVHCIETESAFDVARAAWMGCPVETFIMDEAENIEDGHENIKSTLERCAQKDMKMMIIWDTIGATSTRNEKLKGPNSGGMAERARLARLMFRDITHLLGKTDSTLILVNQSQMSLGQFSTGDETPIPAIKFHASVRMGMTVKKQRKIIEKNGTERTIGIYSELFTAKNKLTLPKQRTILSILGESGIDSFDTTFEYITNSKIATLSGSWKNIEVEAGVDGPNPVIVTYQSDAQLKEKMEVKHPYLKDYIDYLIYKNSANKSPLLKIKIIEKIWDYEKQFFNKRMTMLSEKELEVAGFIHSQELLKSEKEEAKLEKELDK